MFYTCFLFEIPAGQNIYGIRQRARSEKVYGWDGMVGLLLRCNAVQCNQCQMHTLCDSLSHLRTICQQVTSL